MKKSGREDLGEKDVYMKALFLRCHMLSLPLHYLFFFFSLQSDCSRRHLFPSTLYIALYKRLFGR